MIAEKNVQNGTAKEVREKMRRVLILTLVLGLVLGLAGMAVADNATVTVSGTVTGTCKFISGGTISYTLDPSSAGDATGTVSQPTFWCTKGSSYTISDDNGANKSGSIYRMKDTSTDYIAYSFTYTKTGTGGGKGSTKTMDIASKVLNADFINAPAGSYTDTVTLTITP